MMNGFMFKRGMVFLADMNGTGSVGSEQGTHANGSNITAVLITQNDVGNKYSPTVTVAVISSKIHKCKLPTHVLLKVEVGLEKDSVVLCEQIKTIDKQRLYQFCCKLDREKMKEVDRAMKISQGLLDTREEEVLEQLEEVKYWSRNIDELTDDMFASNEQIRQRIARLQIEYNKLKKLCDVKRLYVSDYFVMNEVKYRNLLKDDKKIYATV